MPSQPPPVEGTLTVTEEGTVPAPDWYEDYEGPVEIVTPALTIAIESRGTSSGESRKLQGELAPFPMAPDPWHHYGAVEGKGLEEETAKKTSWTQPDLILFDLGEDFRRYRIEGLTSMRARTDC
ncbi:MAG: hypothetical protein ABEJ55_08170 [Halanaeroarchaeum sp.]